MCDIALIAAVAENRVVGKDGQMPWRLPADLQYFKSKTQGKVVIMGRKTHESIGRLLPNRTNFIVTRQTDHSQFAEGAHLFHDINEAIAAAKERLADDDSSEVQPSVPQEVMIIGGGQIYQATLPLANRLYLTEVHATPKGDAFFPPLNLTEWRQVSRQRFAADEHNQFDYSFVQLDRVGSKESA